MATYTQGTKDLKLVVKKAMALTDAPKNKWRIYYEMAIDGYRELLMNHVKGGIKVSKLTVDSDLKTVDFPDDYIEYVDIAVPVNGELWSLTNKRKINTTTTLTDGSEAYDTSIGEGDNILNTSWSGYSSRGGANTEGLYVIDEENRRIMLRNFTGTTIWLVYKVSGVILDGTTSVPVKYEKALIAYTAYNAIRFRQDVAANFKADLERQYDNEARSLRNTEWGTLQELWDTLYEVAIPLPTR